MNLFGEFGLGVFTAAFAALIGVPVFFVLARVLFRYTPPGNLTSDQLAQMAHQTQNYNRSAVSFGIRMGIVAGVGFWAVCATTAAWCDEAMPAHVFLYRVGGDEFWNMAFATPAFFIGLVATYWGHVLAIRLRFDSDGLRAWQIVGNYKLKFNAHRLLNTASVLSVAISLGGAALLLDDYTRVEGDRFVENEFLGLGEKSHPYTDVKMIARTTHVHGRNGAESAFSQLHVYFADGTVWTAEPAEYYQPLVEFLTQKTGKRLIIARHTEDLLSI